MDFVLRALERLRQDRHFSRNRYFVALSSPEGRRALRIHRHLRSLERDLTAAGARTDVSEEGDRVRLTIRGPRGVRTAWLPRAEFRILCATDAVRDALGGAAAPAQARDRAPAEAPAEKAAAQGRGNRGRR